MAVQRQQNWLGQQRVDIPHLRSVEAGVAGDFDVLAGQVLAGGRPMVVSGFKLLHEGVGQAPSLRVEVAGSLLLHPSATESGSLFQAAPDRDPETLVPTNTRVSGSFVPGSVNYVGVDLTRLADDASADEVTFLDMTTVEEAPEEVPLARMLDYVLVISTSDFGTTPTVAPIAKVTTDAANAVVSVEDARNMLFRLGTGGSNPDATNQYSWPGGREDDSDDFSAADRAIGSLKDAFDALATRLWELGGGERWYSPTADRNVTLLGTGGTFGGSGDYFEWDGDDLHWKNLSILFDNSDGYINEIADQTTNSPGLTDLDDGECIYVDLDRSQNLTGVNALVAVKSTLTALGLPTVPGSRYVIAWRNGSACYYRGKLTPVGASSVPAATTSVIGSVLLSGTPPDPDLPVVGTLDADNRVMATGLTRAGSEYGAGTVAIANDDTDDTELTLGHGSMTVPVKLLCDRGLNIPIRTGSVPTPDAGQGTLFTQENGLSTPNTRVQLCVVFPDGVTLVLAESNPY